MTLTNSRPEMSWYNQGNDDFESKVLIESKLILSSIGAADIVIQGKDSWGVDIILFDWDSHSHELMLILYDGPGKAEIIVNNLVTGKSKHFENELDLHKKLTKELLLNLK